ncbi:hypothetical protein Bca52824_024875 [Brassica carinata]|uniref:RING-type domain-containing protein n=1 Tax=Brassica carinata TaxID=52824 RepID=A0A8X7VLH8_BRACI|nr:hypothetical protein Bca52824_024875 [Brassica carinata]
MVADSISDSQLIFHGSPILRDVFKKRKADLLRKLKHCKVDDARRSKWTHQSFVDAIDDSSDDYSDAMSMFVEEGPSQSGQNKSTSTAKPEPSPEKATDDQKKEEDDHCPPCAEKMDETDLLFEPCSSCGYKMCLFCYKTINEDTGVCPGCRKKYEQQTSSNNGGVSFQQRGGDPVTLSSSFQGLDSD